MARRESGKRITGWATAVTLLAAAPLLAACHGHSSSRSHSSSASHGSSHSSSGSVSKGSGSSRHKGSRRRKGSRVQAGGPSTSGAAAGAWVSAVIEKDAKQACLLSIAPGSESSPKAATSQTCNASMMQKLAPGLASMSKAFMPRNGSGKPTVKVNAPEPTGDSAVVPTSKINVDGQPLRAIILSRSHGVDQKSFRARLETDKINGKWYVGDFDMDAGDQTLSPQGQ